MADEVTTNLLKNNGLEVYIDVFKEEQIDEEVFSLIDKDAIEKLIPIIGHQLKLRKLINSFKDAKSNEVSRSCNKSVIEKEDNATVTLVGSDESKTDSTSLCQSFTHNINDINQEITLFKVKEVLKEKKKMLFNIFEQADHEPSLSDKHAINRVLTDWLCTCTKGYPSNIQKKQLANAICLAYPKLKSRGNSGCDFWYQEHSSTAKSGGLIEIRVKNWRKRLPPEDRKFIRANPSQQLAETQNGTDMFSDEMWHGKKNSTVQTEEMIDQRLKSQRKNLEDDNFFRAKPSRSRRAAEINSSSLAMNSAKIWLKEFSFPHTEVIQNMIRTYPLRSRDSTLLSMSEMLLEWPQLMKEEFIRLDFDMLYNSHSNTDCLLTKFPLDARKVITLSSKDDKNLLDSKDFQTENALLSLPRLLPQGNIIVEVIGKRRKTVKPSYEDTLKSFIVFFKEGTTIEDLQSDDSSSSKKPFIVAIGVPENIVEVFVILNNYRHCVICSSLLSAVDVLFKVFHIFNLKYPDKAKNVFLFLEHFYYELPKSYSLSSSVLFLSDRLCR